MDVPKERIAFGITAIGFAYLVTSDAVRAGAVFGTNSSLFIFAALMFLLAFAVDMFYEGNATD